MKKNYGLVDKNYKKYARVKIDYETYARVKKTMVKWKKKYGQVEKKLRLSGNKTTVVKLVYLRLETLSLYVN